MSRTINILNSLKTLGELLVGARTLGVGTDEPVDFGPGYTIVTVDGELGSGIYQQADGITQGSLLAAGGTYAIATTGAVPITLAVDGTTRIRIDGDGTIVFPELTGAGSAALQVDATGKLSRV